MAGTYIKPNTSSSNLAEVVLEAAPGNTSTSVNANVDEDLWRVQKDLELSEHQRKLLKQELELSIDHRKLLKQDLKELKDKHELSEHKRKLLKEELEKLTDKNEISQEQFRLERELNKLQLESMRTRLENTENRASEAKKINVKMIGGAVILLILLVVGFLFYDSKTKEYDSKIKEYDRKITECDSKIKECDSMNRLQLESMVDENELSQERFRRERELNRLELESMRTSLKNAENQASKERRANVILGAVAVILWILLLVLVLVFYYDSEIRSTRQRKKAMDIRVLFILLVVVLFCTLSKIMKCHADRSEVADEIANIK